MDSTSQKLDNLPTEVLRRIISLTPCESVLVLLRVNRTLYHACNDRLVFKSVINNRSGHKVPRWLCTPLSIEASTFTWARYALADSKAANLCGEFDLDDFARWAPHLMASHHPFMNSACGLSLIEKLDTVCSSSLDNIYALVFCLAARLISGEPADEGRICRRTLSKLTRSDHPLVKTVTKEHDLARAVLHPADLPPLPLSMRPSPLKELTQANLLVVILVLWFYLGLSGCPRNPVLRSAMQGQPATLCRPPKGRHIPFLSMMDLPLLFAANPGEFGTCHLPKMTSQEFFEDGEWTGYYCYNIMKPRFDPPMHSIRFAASQSHDLPSELTLHATGRDSIGTFRLDGTVAQKTGRVMLTKQYIGAHNFCWSSTMTPFGLVGTWALDFSTRAMGVFWLWKACWTNT